MASRTASAGNFTAAVLTVASVNNLPGGSIGYASITAASNTWTTTATNITGMSITVTVNSNRRIKVVAHGTVETGGAEAVADIFLWEDATTALRKDRFGGGAGSQQYTFHIEHYLNPTSGSHTYNLKGDRVTGSNPQYVDASTNGGTGYGPAYIEVVDMGPSF